MPTPLVVKNLEEVYEDIRERFIHDYVDWSKTRRCPRCRSLFFLNEDDKQLIRVNHYDHRTDSFWVTMQVICPVCEYDATERGVHSQYIPRITPEKEPTAKYVPESRVAVVGGLFMAAFILLLVLSLVIHAAVT